MAGKRLFKVFIVISIFLIFIGSSFLNLWAKEITIKVGLAMDQTGPLATTGRKGIDAFLLYQEYFNDEKGGLKDLEGNTVKLKILYGDTGFTPGKTLSLYRKFKDEGAVAIGSAGSVEVAAMRDAALKDKIPLPTNSGALIYPLPSPCFGHWPDYTAVSTAAIDYIKEKWGKSDAPWTKKRSPKLAFIGPEAYPSWEASISPEVLRYAKLQGVEIVGKFFFPLHPIDVKPQILGARKVSADFVYTGVVVSQAGALIKDLYDLGLKGDPTKNEGKIEVVTMFPVSPLETIKLAGGREDVVEGIIIIGGLADPWEDVLELRILRKYVEKHGKMKEYDPTYVHEWYAAMRTCKAVEIALQKLSADKVKGSDVWDGFLNIRDLDTGGILPNKVTFSEEDRLGIKKVRIDRVRGEKRILVKYTDYKTLAPMYTDEYAKAHGKKSIYSEESLKLMKLTQEDVGYKRIKE